VPDTQREAAAIWFAGPRQVALWCEAVPEVGPGEVRVQAVVSALSHGTEMLVYRGQVPAGLSLDLPTLQGSFSFPIKYGYASVGRVVEVGSDVSRLQENDLVFVHHPHQTEYVVPATLPVRLPAAVEPEVGVFLANLETAINVTLDAHPHLGDRILIFGQGVVGLLLTQLMKRAGAGLLVVVEPEEMRRQLAQQVGADVVLSPSERLPDAIREPTHGVGADVIVEVSGSGQALAQAIDCAAFQGTIVVCSWYGTKPVTVPLGGAFHRNRLRLVSSQVGTVNPALHPRWNRERRLALALDLLPSSTLTPLITHRSPVSRASEAYDLVDRRPGETGQVVLTYGAGSES
jgi:2-desacetyl-2-hydroxyethyl bacteriochlorophyllide A dehydrogenase